MKQITTESFTQDVVNSDLPVMVDFYATWCGPCKSIAPALDELSESFQGKCTLVKVDVDESRELATQFGIRSVPTFLIFKGGEVVDTKTGAVSRAQIEDFINSAI